MTDLSPIQILIQNHINAQAEHSRLFDLNDWGLVDGDTETAALDPLDDALIAICGAHPTTSADAELRRRYLVANLIKRLEGCPDLTGRAVKALIGAGGAA